MRILRIIHTLDPSSGGPVEALLQTSRLHSLWGHETDVACGDVPESEFHNVAELKHLKIHPLGPSSLKWGYSPKWKPWLYSNSKRFDLVIIHGLWLYPSFVAMKVLMEKSVPWYVFTHGMLDPWFQSWKRRPLKTARNWLYWNLIEKKVINNATAVLYTSAREKELAETTFNAYRGEGKVMPYGTTSPPGFSESMLDKFKSKCPLLGAQSYFLFLSRIHSKKGIELLLMAYSKLLENSRDQWGDDIPDLVLAGPAFDDKYLERIKGLANSINSRFGRACIHFPGMLRNDEKWGAFYGCEAFVLPSFQENFGVAVAEALACAKAVLISDQVNICAEVRNYSAGLISSATEEGVENLLRQWMCLDDQRKQKLSSNARRLFAEEFEVSKAAKAIIALGNS